VLPMEKEINLTKDCGATEDTLTSESTTLDAGYTTRSSLPYTLSTAELTSTAITRDVVKKYNDSFVRFIVTQCFKPWE